MLGLLKITLKIDLNCENGAWKLANKDILFRSIHWIVILPKDKINSIMRNASNSLNIVIKKTFFLFFHRSLHFVKCLSSICQVVVDGWFLIIAIEWVDNAFGGRFEFMSRTHSHPYNKLDDFNVRACSVLSLDHFTFDAINWLLSKRFIAKLCVGLCSPFKFRMPHRITEQFCMIKCALHVHVNRADTNVKCI